MSTAEMGGTVAEQRAAIELVSVVTRAHDCEGIRIVLDHVTSLLAGGENANTLAHWLSLLPAARRKAPREHTPTVIPRAPVVNLNTCTAHPEPVQFAGMRCPVCLTRVRNRKTRPLVADCHVCGDQFTMNPVGRVSRRCDDCRRRQKKRAPNDTPAA